MRKGENFGIFKTYILNILLILNTEIFQQRITPSFQVFQIIKAFSGGFFPLSMFTRDMYCIDIHENDKRFCGQKDVFFDLPISCCRYQWSLSNRTRRERHQLLWLRSMRLRKQQKCCLPACEIYLAHQVKSLVKQRRVDRLR